MEKKKTVIKAEKLSKIYHLDTIREKPLLIRYRSISKRVNL